VTDDTPVTLRQAAALVGRPVATVRKWAAHRRMRPLYRLRNRDYYRPADVRAAAASVGPQGRRYREEREPTAEEVERTVAEQMKPENLPSWWTREAERQRRRAGGVRIVRVAARVPTDCGRDFTGFSLRAKRKAG
jgi:hypothetical protein